METEPYKQNLCFGHACKNTDIQHQTTSMATTVHKTVKTTILKLNSEMKTIS